MTGGRVLLPRDVRRAILGHARREAPRECCGLLLGSKGVVRYALPMRNVDPQPTRRFRIDDREHIVVRRWLRDLAPVLGIVGVYHSHPKGAAAPSAADVAEAHYPEWLWLIVGLAGGRAALAAFRIGPRGARRLALDQPPRRPTPRKRPAV